MSDSEDDLKLNADLKIMVIDPKVKNPAKRSDHEKAALLSSGDEEDGDEDDDEEGITNYTGEILNGVNCEDGLSISGSDDEVTAFTGEQETYIGDSNNNIDQLGLREEVVKKPKVREGTLIAINDEDVIDPIEPITDDDEEDGAPPVEVPPPVLPTNDNISEIANKLKESELLNEKESDITDGLVMVRDNQDYLESMGFRESASSCGEVSVENGGYSSSGDTSHTARGNDVVRKERKKRLRKTKNGSMDKEENIIKNGGDHLETNGYKSKQINGLIIENGLSKNGSKSSLSQSDDDFRRKNVHKSPVSTRKANNKTGSESDRSSTKTVNNSNNNKSVNKKRTRTRTRHKVYLDDPDVHQLINEHVVMLKRFMEGVHDGKFNKGLVEQDHEQTQSLPNINFAGGIQNNKTADIQSSKSSYSVGPYGHHKSRGKDMISRIRNDSLPYESEEEDEYTNGEIYNHKQQNGSTQESSELYEICPDCGERHPPDELVDEAEICPDCGVQHNPYQHTPSAQKPWHKYMEACRKTLIPGKRYEQVSTEQDPEDATQEELPSIEGPHTMEELAEGIRYKLKYLGSSQIVSQHPITKETRMQQAQDAFNRIKGPEDDEDDVSTNVDMLLSLERIKILNQDTKFEDVMMDHALRTVCFICDMGKILVLMARRLTSDHSTDFSLEQGKPISLGNIVGDREKKTSKNICHVFETDDASKIAKAIGQAFNIAYRNFLQSNGISHEHVEEAEYCHVLESQKLVGADLDRLTDQSNAKEVVLNKKGGEQLGVMLLESGWGSMLPTVFVAHIANYSVAARCQQLTVGDHVLSCNGSSLVGIPLSECNTILKNSRSSNRVVLRTVTCPPVVDVVITRPDVKYQLGFSVQNGTICSLLRGGIAERGGVRVGHRIIEINGDSVVAKSHQYIVDLLANTIGSIGMKTMPIAMYRLMVGDDQPQHV